MKKIILSAATLLCAVLMFAGTLPEVNEKVLKAFESTFKNVTDVAWQEFDDHYQVSFKQSAIISRANYDKDGNLLSTRRYYSGDQLPPNILAKLKNKYAEKKIFGVTEISTEESIEYTIVLEDERKWYFISADASGSLWLDKKYNKAPTN